MVAFVSNGGYIDSNSADGLRKTLCAEFHEIYVYNLRGNQRTAGEQSRREGGKIFDSGSRNTVAVLILVKRPGTVDECRLNYSDIGDYLDRKTKLAAVELATIDNLNWEVIIPNEDGDWINQRNGLFESFTPIGDKDGGAGLFRLHCGGLNTARDAWVYNASEAALRRNVERMVGFYNAEVDRYSGSGSVDDFVNTDPSKFSWNRADKVQLARGVKYSIAGSGYRVGAYRPFNKQNVHFSRQLNDMVYRLNDLYPTPDSENLGFYIVGVGTEKPFSALAVNEIPNLSYWGSGLGQFFPRYAYTTRARGEADLFGEPEPKPAGPERIDNITDAALVDYRAAYGPEVTKDDIFHYVYGVLHSPEYRTRFAADLKKMLPRIPQVSGADRFRTFVEAGKALSDLHIGYEELEPYPLNEVAAGLALEQDEYARYAVTKMKYAGKAGAWDKTRIIYNAHITLEGIPEDAQRYMLGSRSAVDWILERYQVKTDKASGIVNDPNDWSREHKQPRYIIDLIGRIVRLSLETNRIVDSLPDLGLPNH